MIKRIIKKIFLVSYPFNRLLLSLFFDKKYIKGKYFQDSVVGNLWAIKSIIHNNIMRLGRPMPWPTGKNCYISKAENITFHPDDLNNFQSFGIYFQNIDGHIYLGQGSYIAPNVGLITTNHKIDNLDEHDKGRDVILGKKCWIGMNSVILPGVILGDNTIVAAGSVVAKSFPDGKCILGGSPAKIIKNL